jgi:hypothetical protein
VTGTLPTANGGTNLTSFTSGGVVYASSTSALATGSALTFDGAKLAVNTSGYVGGRGLDVYGTGALFDGTGQFDMLIGDGGFAYMSLRTADNAASLKIRNHTGSTDIVTFERTSANVLIGGTTNSLSARLLSENAAGNQLALVYTGGGTYCLSVDATNNLIFFSSSTERARIPSTGGIQSVNSISVGNATPSTSGAGITFPATQSASSDANTLDDYEEGTWTPAINGITSVAYTQQIGNYIKIGKQVTCFARLLVSGTGSGVPVTVTGLPFTSASASNSGNGGGAMGYKQLTALSIYPHVVDSSSTIEFLLTETSAPTAFTLTGAVSGYHIFYVTYLV